MIWQYKSVLYDECGNTEQVSVLYGAFDTPTHYTIIKLATVWYASSVTGGSRNAQTKANFTTGGAAIRGPHIIREFL